MHHVSAEGFLRGGSVARGKLPTTSLRCEVSVAKCPLRSAADRCVLDASAVQPASFDHPGDSMSDTYRTVETNAWAEQTVDGSRFLADAVPVASRMEVEARIEQIRGRERKATHHCSAYRLGRDGDDFRCDDDREPSGTAGPPILRQIDAWTLTDTLVVVTRYFGGTELGTSGLVWAYGDAASAALDRSPIVERVMRTPVRLRFDYNDTSPAQRVPGQFDTEVQDSEYTDVTTLTVGVRDSEVGAFVEAFTDALSGRGELLQVGNEEDESRG